MKFVANGMLGKLARWLRLSGYDVLYDDFKDEEILGKAKNRIILTKDKKLCEKAKKAGFSAKLVKSDDVEGQLSQLKSELRIKIRDAPWHSRCPVCNGDVEKVEKEYVKQKVPDGIFRKIDQFWRCTSCKKIYWYGGHWKNIKKIVQKLS